MNIPFRTTLIVMVLMVLTFVLHEGAHLLMAKALGYEASASLNRVTLVGAAWTTTRDAMLVTAAGPAITVLQGIIGWLAASGGGSRLGFLVVFVAAYHRLLAAVISLQTPNDEMRLSIDLEIGAWTLPAVVVGFLAWLALLAASRSRPGWTRVVWAFVGASIAVTAVVFSEPYLPRLTF